MKIKIHRPAQIGGCITEIATATSRIIIDLGHNLPSAGDEPDNFDNADIIRCLTKDCDAIFYTHYHGDHVDLFHHVPDNIPQWMGSYAKKIMKVKYETLRMADKVEKIDKFNVFKAAQRILIHDDMVVTPFFVNHSAYDSYMFLIEAEGRRILHTGDFRSHGFLGSGLKKILPLIGHIDVLIIEGTMLNRPNGDTKSMWDICEDMKRVMATHKYVFAMCSSTDADTLAALQAANMSFNKHISLPEIENESNAEWLHRMSQHANEGKRMFVCDEYQKRIFGVLMTAVLRPKGAPSLYNMCHPSTYIFSHELLPQMQQKGFCMLVRAGHFNIVKRLMQHFDSSQTAFIYSLWDGYLDKTKPYYKKEYENMWSLFTQREIIHTSGHADKQTLAMVCNTLVPRLAIIPIHRELTSDFASLPLKDELKDRIVTANKTVYNIQMVFD